MREIIEELAKQLNMTTSEVSAMPLPLLVNLMEEKGISASMLKGQKK